MTLCTSCGEPSSQILYGVHLCDDCVTEEAETLAEIDFMRKLGLSEGCILAAFEKARALQMKSAWKAHVMFANAEGERYAESLRTPRLRALHQSLLDARKKLIVAENGEVPKVVRFFKAVS